MNQGFAKIILSLLFVIAIPSIVFSQPERVPSFGPNGTHWPNLLPTPFMYDRTVPNIIEVPASWTAIKTALQGVSEAQANAGTLILVAPGNLVGLGKSGSSTSVLENLGSKAWSKRVTIAPRDGYGTVTWTGGTKIQKVFGVAFAGFKVEDSIRFVGNTNSALAWMRINGEQMGVYGTSGQTTEKVELVEIVRKDFQVTPDPGGSGSYGNDNTDVFAGGGAITNWKITGSYFEPRYWRYPYVGSKPHTDTFQFATGSGGTYSDMTIQDSAFFTSNNCAIQVGNLDGLLLDHSFVASQTASKRRYPALVGTNPDSSDGWASAFNGSGKNFRAQDSIILGKLALNNTDTSRIWNSASNTLLVNSTSPTLLNIPLSGSWKFIDSDDLLATDLITGPADPNRHYTLSDWKQNVESKLDAYEYFTLKDRTIHLPNPSDSYLEEIWSNPGEAIKVRTPVFSLAAGTYNSAQTVSLTSNTAGAKIYYTTNGTIPNISSQLYTAPINITQSMTVKAIAVASGLSNSDIVSATYVISVVNLKTPSAPINLRIGS